PGGRRHTRFSRDWSSDVCSADLPVRTLLHHQAGRLGHRPGAFTTDRGGAAGNADPGAACRRPGRRCHGAAPAAVQVAERKKATAKVALSVLLVGGSGIEPLTLAV